MTRTIAICALMVAAGVVVTLSICTPWVLGDDNVFLKAFVTDQLLNVLGIIVTITLASAGQLHLTFDAMEEKRGERFLHGTRQHLKEAAFWLIWLFLGAMALVVIKPFAVSYAMLGSLVNGTALLMLLLNVLILIEITQTVFAVEPDTNLRQEPDRRRDGPR